jgi:hypothetical protein
MGVDDRRHRIGRIVKAVDEFKSKGDQQGDRQQKISCCRGSPAVCEEVTEELGGRPTDAADQDNPEDNHRDLALFFVHFFFEKRALTRGGHNRRISFVHAHTLHTTGVRTVPKCIGCQYELWYPAMLKFC